MLMRVEKIGGEYCLRLTSQMVETLQLSEGAEVEVQPVRAVLSSSGQIGAEEAMDSYLRTESRYAEVYRELAK